MKLDRCAQAGLLIAETEFALQVESDIAPYKGLLMGLFFMTVGMEISVGLFFARIKTVMAGILGLLIGKVRPTSTLSICAYTSLIRLSYTKWLCIRCALNGGGTTISGDTFFMQVAIITALGPLFGLSRVQAARSGLLLAAGGEFAFVAL